jgi:excisionase family DNA binding protein
MDDDPSHRLPQVEHTLLSVWRRTVTQGGGPQLTLAEAAALLGSSVDSVRRRIKAGQIRAFRDRSGRIRVDTSVTYDPFEEEYVPDATDSEAVSRLWEELKQVRAKLEESESEISRLLNELQATENALEYTKTEVANLWRAMTTRNVRQTQIEYPSPPDHTVVLDFAQERHRIQGKIADVRSLARRRKWPWPQTG